MSEKTMWADIDEGDEVELAGRLWRVTKIKRRDKKTAKVTVERDGRKSSDVVKLKDRVRLAKARPPVQDASGTQRRWATERELEETLAAPIPTGNRAQTTPPKKAAGPAWDAPLAGVEKTVQKSLGAILVAESEDEKIGYYVPPVDVTTVAAHLAVFHGGIPDACDGEMQMLKAHDAQHAGAAKGESTLAVNHWHTERRP